MIRRLAGAALVLALAVSACGGESKEDKAQAKVCSARADIKKQVDELKSTTITSASIDGVQANLQAISKSMQAMVKAQKDLKGDRKEAVQTATQTFTTEVTNVGRQVITSLSAEQRGAADPDRGRRSRERLRQGAGADRLLVLMRRAPGLLVVLGCSWPRRRRPRRRRSTTGRSRTRGSRSSGRRRRARS